MQCCKRISYPEMVFIAKGKLSDKLNEDNIDFKQYKNITIKLMITCTNEEALAVAPIRKILAVKFKAIFRA